MFTRFATDFRSATGSVSWFPNTLGRVIRVTKLCEYIHASAFWFGFQLIVSQVYQEIWTFDSDVMIECIALLVPRRYRA